jgi:hypothetical protein
MLFTLAGIVSLSYASSFGMIIAAVILLALVPIFHPEASRISFLASGGKRGLAQSIFQLGGNADSNWSLVSGSYSSAKHTILHHLVCHCCVNRIKF